MYSYCLKFQELENQIGKIHTPGEHKLNSEKFASYKFKG